MGKVLKIVGAVVGVAALLIPGVGSAISGAIFGTLAGGAVGTLAAAAFTFSQVVVAGLSIYGLATISKMLGPKSPKIPSSSRDRLYSTIDPSTPRKMVLGRTAMANDIRYEEWGGADQEYLDRIVTVASHRVESVDEIWIEDKLAWTSAGGVQGEYVGYLTVAVRTEGTAANTIAINGGAKWGSSRRLTGCAYLHLRYKLTGNDKKVESPFASSIPQRMTIIGAGAPMYDPRADSTVGGSGSQRADDQSTWGWVSDDVGNNTALQILWYLLGWRINGKLAVGRGMPPARLDMASFIAAANLCDESVSLAAGGTEKRYRSAGVVSESDVASAVLEALCAACAGSLRDAGGQLSLSVLHNDLSSPIASFADDDVLSEFDWQQASDVSFNEVRGRYTDPSDNALYQLVDYPPARLDSVDDIERPHPFDLAFVQSASQAQRLAKQELQRAQFPAQFSASFKATAWRCQVGDCVTLTFSTLGFVNKLFRVVEQTIRMDGTCPMTLREENAAIYAWSAEETAAVVAAPPTTYDPLNAPLIQGVIEALDSATSGALAINPGNAQLLLTPDGSAAVDPGSVLEFNLVRISAVPGTANWTLRSRDSAGIWTDLDPADYLSAITGDTTSASAGDLRTALGADDYLELGVEIMAGGLTFRAATAITPSYLTGAMEFARNSTLALPTNADGHSEPGHFAGMHDQLVVTVAGYDVTSTIAFTDVVTVPEVTGSLNTAADTPVTGEPAGYYEITDVDDLYLGGLAISFTATFTYPDGRTQSGDGLISFGRVVAPRGEVRVDPTSYQFDLDADGAAAVPGETAHFTASQAGMTSAGAIAWALKAYDSATALWHDLDPADYLSDVSGATTSLEVDDYLQALTDGPGTTLAIYATTTVDGLDYEGIAFALDRRRGVNPLSAVLKSDIPGFKYDATGTIVSGQTAHILAAGQNYTGDPEARLYRLSSGGSETQIDAGTYLTVPSPGVKTDNTPDANTFTFTGAKLELTGSNFNTALSTGVALIIETTWHRTGEPDLVLREIIYKVTDGTNGTNGLNGTNTAVVTLYQRAASAPSLPGSTLTYTFSTGVLSGTLGSWTQSVPSGSNPLWVTQATAVGTGSTDTISSGEWSSTVKLAENGAAGADGLNSASVFIYQRSASGAPTLPSASTTYTFSTGGLTGLNNGWSRTIPGGTDPLYVSVATASATTATDTIGSGEWAAAQIFAQNGTNGSNGLNTAIVYIYQRATSAPSVPSATATFTFATGGITGLNNGWSASIPSGTNPLYVTAATASGSGSTDTIATGEWATPQVLAQNGTDGTNGLNSASVFLYQRAASAPSVPGSTTTYTFATGVLSGTLGSWQQTVPAGSNPLYVITATAIGSGSTDTIATGEWSAPAIMAQDGAQGPAGLNNARVQIYQRSASGAPTLPSATTTFTFATGGLTGLNNGWSTSIPAGSDPLYTSLAIASSATSTDTISSGEWASAVLLVQDGATGAAGLNSASVFLYQRSASAPSVPGSTLTYTFATGGLSGTLGGWTRDVPSGTLPVWVTQAVAAATTSTDTIGTGEWATPTILAQDGSSGAQGLWDDPLFLLGTNAFDSAPATPWSLTTTGAGSGYPYPNFMRSGTQSSGGPYYWKKRGGVPCRPGAKLFVRFKGGTGNGGGFPHTAGLYFKFFKANGTTATSTDPELLVTTSLDMTITSPWPDVAGGGGAGFITTPPDAAFMEFGGYKVAGTTSGFFAMADIFVGWADAGANSTEEKAPSIRGASERQMVSLHYDNTVRYWPTGLQFYRYQGNTDVSAATTWSVDNITMSVTSCTINSSGVLSITPGSTPKAGSCTINADYAGVRVSKKISFVFDVVDGSPPPNGVAFAYDTPDATTLTSTSYVVIAGPYSLKLDTGHSSVTFGASLGACPSSLAGTGFCEFGAFLECQTSPGTWTRAGTYWTTGTVPYRADEQIVGYTGGGQTTIGTGGTFGTLTAGNTYDFRWVARLEPANGGALTGGQMKLVGGRCWTRSGA